MPNQGRVFLAPDMEVYDMRRKIIQLAGKTLVVSLPSDWVKELGLKKGQEVEVSRVGRSMVIEQPSVERGHIVKVDLSGLNASLVWHSIISHYVAGAGEIQAGFSKERVMDPRTGLDVHCADAIEKVVENLIGMEIVRQSKSMITIREISSVAPEEYDNVMRRVWLTCLGMVEDGSDALAKGDSEGFKAAVRVEKNVNRLVLYALRMLNRGVASNVSAALVDARVLHSLEGFADVIASCAKSSDKDCLSGSAKVLRSAYDYWFKPSNESADAMYNALMVLRKKKGSSQSLVAAAESVVEAVAPAHVLGR